MNTSTSSLLRPLVLAGLLAVGNLFASSRPAAGAEPPEFAGLEQSYARSIRPLVVKYCQACHADDRLEADLDLKAFGTLTDVRRQPQAWIKIRDMLESGQMPPEESKQPTAEERRALTKWVLDYLTLEARSQAGDPGKVIVRRLSNAEYTYTIRDLTGVVSLEPAREFPMDGAAGEGFTNTGNALVMSPSLITKYLDAGKDIADHMVLLPDGFRFSPSTSRRDWTDDLVAQIRAFYRSFTDAAGGTQVNLQGIVGETNTGGRLPIARYLQATVVERDRLLQGQLTIAPAAEKHGLNTKYLGILWKHLTSEQPSLILDGLRARWRVATPEQVPALAAEVTAWQNELWKFATVGHIGKVGGPKAWMEPVSPLTTRHEVRYKIPDAGDADEVTLALVVTDAGDGREHDFAIWENPRLVTPGRPDLPLRDLRQTTRNLAARRERVLARTAQYLKAADEVAARETPPELEAVAKKYELEVEPLQAWLEYLGVAGGGSFKLEGHFTDKIGKASGYEFINGWGRDETPLLVANSSDTHVRIPGNMKPHSVAVHPSPTLRAAVGWRSPIRGKLRIDGQVTHAHPECGNGVTWSVELRRGGVRQRLAAGVAHGSAPVTVGPLDNVVIHPGDLISLCIGARDGNHSCDLTAVELSLTELKTDGKVWKLSDDVSGNIHAGNPHADRFGQADVWHFYTEPEKGAGALAPVIPAGSALARWQAATTAAERDKIAQEVQQVLTAPRPAAKDAPDTQLHRQLTSFGGPLFRPAPAAGDPAAVGKAAALKFGPDPELFGKHPDGRSIGPANLCLQAPAVVEFRVPADLVAGSEFVATGTLDPESGREGSVQLRVLPRKPERDAGLVPSNTKVTIANGQWSADNRRTSFGTPILVTENSQARQRVEAAFDEFRNLFPAALCYTTIIPIDEVVTLTLHYREDQHLVRLMLDEAQTAKLNRLWAELHYVSQDALTLVDALAQLIEYATQDADPKVFEPLRQPFNERAAAYRQQLVKDEHVQMASLLEFSARAYRRPLTVPETAELQGLYRKLREQDLPHDAALRLTLARVLVSPAFLYRLEQPPAGKAAAPVNDWELASRLSYFLWSSPPDAELLQAAAAGKLQETATLVAQARRMLQDPRTRRLATEFACQWLHVYDFDRLDEKSERHFPMFVGLRGAMYEETIQFFTHLFQENGSVLNILDADYTYVNDDLARLYGLPVESGEASANPTWRRVNGVRALGRGGILGQAATLAKQSGASRTSPILRGNWVSEVLLGEKLPKPPKEVPRLPEDEQQTDGLTVRQLVERHSTEPKCAVCHQRIDAFGFALEAFDAIGRRRDRDLADRPIDTRIRTPDGAEFDGQNGLREYLLTVRRDAFLKQFCRKLLGYSLGRAVQLSDEPLLTEMQNKLREQNYAIGALVETIVSSPQFRTIRGREFEASE